MKLFIGLASATVALLFAAAVVFANPATLPKHPGYPIGDPKSPVTGESLANDTNQENVFGEQANVTAATAADSHVYNKVTDANNQRLKSSRGAGQLPEVDGPEFFSEPPVKEATRMR